MNRLFSYTIPIDDGAAPNPFYGICTLAICKPRIRSVAKVGDWIAGLGARNSPSGDLSGKLVYAMRVDEVLTMEQYDSRCHAKWAHRIPKVGSLNPLERLGDCIYDYSKKVPELRPSVHGHDNVTTDLSGKNVLIANEFYYFGSKAISLPENLKGICHQTQGHKSNMNNDKLLPFIKWIRGQGFASGMIHGWPDFVVKWTGTGACNGCSVRIEAALSDC